MTEARSGGGGGALDSRALRRCLGSFATGVAVVTTRHRDQDWGITINSFTSVSLDPPLVLWCLARSSRTVAAFTAVDHFVVNVLATDQVAISNRFAFRSENEFPSDVPVLRGIAGVPLIEGTCSAFQCRRSDLFDGGDHVVLVGEVLDFRGSDRAGLVYRRGQYAVAESHPSVFASSSNNLDQGYLDAAVRPALEGITRRFESFFDVELLDAGISSREAQVLGLLLVRDSLSAEDIANVTLVSGSSLEETIDSLVGKDLIARPQGTCALTSAGRTLAASWNEKLRSCKARSLGRIAPAEAAAMKRTLARLSEWIDSASSGDPRAQD
jgi:flavin reductase (DIM6/NTAB) family NADH-FMN oxidoreductase RutF/DNA-binding MarR family transcriptional regulator